MEDTDLKIGSRLDVYESGKLDLVLLKCKYKSCHITILIVERKSRKKIRATVIDVAKICNRVENPNKITEWDRRYHSEDALKRLMQEKSLLAKARFHAKHNILVIKF